MQRTARTVVVQPADPSKDRKNKLSQKKVRVAYYARVSTNSDEQKTSFDTQKAYYEEKIHAHSNWELVRGYADEGISALNTVKRDQFNQMIKDCEAGKIDLILTKSISRFARNTVDTLTTVRNLQRMGISVIFEKENINTANQDCEMLLTIFGSIAQEESRSISENVKWALKAKFERGEIMLCTNRFWGYDKDEEGNLIINEEQADVVRLIAKLYLDGMSWERIARELECRGIKTITGKEKWCASTVGSILSNEKYAGYAIQGKTYTEDFLTKKRAINKGEKPLYKAINSIPAILPMEVFMKIQEEKARRSLNTVREKKIKYGKYALSDLLRCSHCGNKFRRVGWRLGGKSIPVYRCKSTQTKGTSCGRSPTLKESDIERNIMLAINEVKQVNNQVTETVLSNVKNVIITDDYNMNQQKRFDEIQKLVDDEYLSINHFDNMLMRKMIERVNVNEDCTIEIHFRFGAIVTKQLESARVRD